MLNNRFVIKTEGAIMQKKDGNNSNDDNLRNGSPKGDDILQVGDRIFRKVELGLDEKEVRSYVEELVSERDALVKRQEHLSALAELAEKTVIEANNLAQQTKQKAADQAKAEAEVIRTKAEQETEQFIQQKKAEAQRAAGQEAENIKAQALKQMELMREEQFNVLKAEAKSVAQRMQEELLSSIESIKRQVMTLSNKFEEMPSLSNVPFPSVPLTAEVGPDTVDYPVEKTTSFDHIPWLEVEVLPPVDIGKIMDLISRLESLPAVKTTDLLPEMPNPLIRVFLNEPSPLAELLRTLPQVEKVTEAADFETDLDSDIPTGNKKERIQVVLGDNQKSKNKDSKKETTQATAK
jgi:hypothetical protein